MGPLSGLRVLDMTTVLMGPYATLQLGDMGADIIKVEPLEGDIVRQIGPGRNPGMGPMFLNVNRNKRSIALDLKQPAGRDVVLRLAADADVFIYNVRPQAVARLGLAYEEGTGRQHSDYEAYLWYGKAALAGESGARARQAKVATKLQASERQQADRLIDQRQLHNELAASAAK